MSKQWSFNLAKQRALGGWIASSRDAKRYTKLFGVTLSFFLATSSLFIILLAA